MAMKMPKRNLSSWDPIGLKMEKLRTVLMRVKTMTSMTVTYYPFSI